MELVDPIVFRLTIFVLAIFVGYFVVWSVTPALHTPLMSVTNAISSVIVVGALIAVAVSTNPSKNVVVDFNANGNIYVNHKVVSDYKAPTPVVMQRVEAATRLVQPPSGASAWISKLLGVFALILACVNIFGGFLVTSRMLAMYKKKDAPARGEGHT